MHDSMLVHPTAGSGKQAVDISDRQQRHGLPNVSVIILAAKRRNEDDDFSQHSALGKAMANLHGKPMLAYVIAAVVEAGIADEIIVVADSDLTQIPAIRAASCGVQLHHVAASDSLCGSVTKALQVASVDRPVLITTADNALLSPSSVREFYLSAVKQRGISVGAVSESVIEERYPANKRTYHKFRDIKISGANLFCLNGRDTEQAIKFWRSIESYRKRPWKIAAAFGPLTLFNMLLGRLNLSDAFRQVSRTVGIDVRIVQLSEAEAAMDVDRWADFIQAESILASRSHPQGSAESPDNVVHLSERPLQDEPKHCEEPKKSFAVFDLDRTITRRGTYTPFLLSMRKTLFGRFVLLLRILIQMANYKLARIDRLTLKNRMLTLATKGMDAKDVEAAADAFVARTVENGLRGGCQIAIIMHKLDGDQLILATASLDLYAIKLARTLGFDQVVCTKTAACPEGLSPFKIVGENCYGVEKFQQVTTRLKQQAGDHRADYFVSFYSDHHADMELLEWSDVPVVVCPGIKTHSMAVVRNMNIVVW